MRLYHPLEIRVASRYLEAQRLVNAKNQYLKAIDFAFQVLNRMKLAGYKFESAPLSDIQARLIFLRKLIQKEGPGIVDSYANTFAKFTNEGARIVAILLKEEREIVPTHEDWRAFVKKISPTMDAAQAGQIRVLTTLISQQTGRPFNEVGPAVFSDPGYAAQAYEIILPLLAQGEQEVVGNLDGLGLVQHRVKAFPSAYKKSQGKTKRPFFELTDLIGTRVVTDSLREMATACNIAQSKMKVVEKENKYFEPNKYLAVHYALVSKGGVVIELQVKSEGNLVEAAISHDLIYKPEMSLIALTPADLKLISRVLDVSLSLSLKDMMRYWESIKERPSRSQEVEPRRPSLNAL